MKREKLVLLLAALCFYFLPLPAQMNMGIKGGLNSASLSGFSGNSRVSGHLGFFLHTTIDNRWCLQPELLYSGEGQRYFADGEERTLALDYIQVPLMLQYFPARQLYIEFGPQLGVLVSAQDKGTGGNFNIKEDFTTTQIGLNLGIGVKANSKLGFYGRYSFGLTDVSRFDNIVDQSRVGQLGMSIRLR